MDLLCIAGYASSLICQHPQDLLPDRMQLGVNDRIILASTLHGISNIAAQLSPVKPSPSQLNFLIPRGITIIETTEFRIHCYETSTGKLDSCPR